MLLPATNEVCSMLYHISLISLHKPFLRKPLAKSPDAPSYSTPSISHLNESVSTCDSSSDIITSILRRFRAQHSLRNAPLSFVHGTIVAIDATLATAAYKSGGIPIVRDTNLPALDASLAELSHAWALASEARAGLREFFNRKGLGSQTGEMRPNRNIGTGSYCPPIVAAAESTEIPFSIPQPLLEAFDGCGTDLMDSFQHDAIESAEPYRWDILNMMDDRSTSWTESQSSSLTDSTASYSFSAVGEDTSEVFWNEFVPL